MIDWTHKLPPLREGWERREGVVTEVRYTQASDGRQRTFIDGQEYATWWDLRTRDWREGDRVVFDAAFRPVWANTPPEWRAENIHKAAAGVGAPSAEAQHAGNADVGMSGAEGGKA